jgi:hypothetical protein
MPAAFDAKQEQGPVERQVLVDRVLAGRKRIGPNGITGEG